MILTLDIGNTRIKAALFENNILSDCFTLPFDSWQLDLIEFVKNNPNVSEIVVSNVGKLNINDFSFIENRHKLFFVDRNSSFPFHNKYQSKATLGIDRMILAAGAVLKFPNQNRLIIDAGTCITYDFITAQNDYLGGAISPGIRLRYEALHTFTSKLPLLENQMPDNFIGNSTNNSIHSGVVNGIIYEIDGFINQYQLDYSNFIIILTGGDAEFLAKRFKNTIFANPNFLLESLYQTYQYQNLK